MFFIQYHCWNKQPLITRKVNLKKIKHLNSSCFSSAPLRACLVCGWAGLQHPSARPIKGKVIHMVTSRAPGSEWSALGFVSGGQGLGESCHKEGEGYSGMAVGHVPLLCQDQLNRPQLSHDAGEYRTCMALTDTVSWEGGRAGRRDTARAWRNRTVYKYRFKKSTLPPHLAWLPFILLRNRVIPPLETRGLGTAVAAKVGGTLAKKKEKELGSREKTWTPGNPHEGGLRPPLPTAFLGKDHRPSKRLSKVRCSIKAHGEFWRCVRARVTGIPGLPVTSSHPRSSPASSLASLPPPSLSPSSPPPSPDLSSLTRALPLYFFCLRPLDCPMGSGSLSPSSSASRSGNFLRFLRTYGWPGRCLCNRATRHCSVFTMQLSTWLPRQL